MPRDGSIEKVLPVIAVMAPPSCRMTIATVCKQQTIKGTLRWGRTNLWHRSQSGRTVPGGRQRTSVGHISWSPWIGHWPLLWTGPTLCPSGVTSLSAFHVVPMICCPIVGCRGLPLDQQNEKPLNCQASGTFEWADDGHM